jgi:hypothetical protein
MRRLMAVAAAGLIAVGRRPLSLRCRQRTSKRRIVYGVENRCTRYRGGQERPMHLLAGILFHSQEDKEVNSVSSNPAPPAAAD